MITKEEVKHIAKLARLGLTEKEIERTQKELSLILDYFKILKEIDTENIVPTSHPVSAKSYLREDKIFKLPPEETEKIIQMAPQKEKRYVRTKAIL